ncbi:TlpA family protein disulfide reductase [Aestuariibaculum sediminum]|uniref:TlpA family protein disulfide reductase n=1 Tax=Aestuariibaculum sediminum TaxID=2770637 RepID=A0A8J6Q0R9_9FLAO|nr:TlpA disulfide reductase family protein [Aestuariibaculum sediminum]MBD0833453.1 TlpA family protein disulfide reductase [Aestuariibaculum sediminum]
MNIVRTFFLTLVTGLLWACNTKEPHPGYVEISGQILNSKSKSFKVCSMGGDAKDISILDDGTFIDSFKVSPQRYKLQLFFEDGKFMTGLYAQNGSDIKLNVNVNKFSETIRFSDDFADYNNYLSDKANIMQSDIGFNKKIWYRYNLEDFNGQVNTLETALKNALHSYKNISEEHIESEEKYINRILENITSKYDEEHSYAAKLSKGSKSPEFNSYENFDGTKTSLSDFKGKYVFIDVWATWCSPCKAQIPYLEELEKEYKNENIVFVSMSVDKPSDRDKWKKMVADKNLSGVQILAPSAFESEFAQAYNINSIPRFILINPDGVIVDFDAPRPSNNEAIHKLLSNVKS